MKDPKTYHHGDLRKALLSAALMKIEETGPSDLSFRELAKQMNVSPAAPYRHFADKQKLIEAMVEVSNAELHKAYMSIPSNLTPLDRLRRANEIYLKIAEQKPQLYSLLTTEYRAWRQPGAPGIQLKPSAFKLYESLVAAAMPWAAPTEIKAATLASWSAKHGFAQLKSKVQLEDGSTWEEVRHAVLNLFLKMVVQLDSPSSAPSVSKGRIKLSKVDGLEPDA